MDKDITGELKPDESYYWFEDHIEIGPRSPNGLRSLPNKGYTKYLEIPSYDLRCFQEHFGKFESSIGHTGDPLLWWKRVFPHEIPKEFLTNLLLLGIDIYAHTRETDHA